MSPFTRVPFWVYSHMEPRKGFSVLEEYPFRGFILHVLLDELPAPPPPPPKLGWRRFCRGEKKEPRFPHPFKKAEARAIFGWGFKSDLRNCLFQGGPFLWWKENHPRSQRRAKGRQGVEPKIHSLRKRNSRGQALGEKVAHSSCITPGSPTNPAQVVSNAPQGRVHLPHLNPQARVATPTPQRPQQGKLPTGHALLCQVGSEEGPMGRQHREVEQGVGEAQEPLDGYGLKVFQVLKSHACGNVAHVCDTI